MPNPARRRATYQDVLDAPPEQIAELINGELHLSRPRCNHTSVASYLTALLIFAFDYGIDGPGGWTIRAEPELHLGEDILVPDLAGWRCERMPEIDDSPFLTRVPDWICEILSPSTEKLDRRDKMSIYASRGVSHAWLVHPARRTLEVFQLRGRKWRMIADYQGIARVRAEPFAAIELDLSMVWHKLIALPHTDRAGESTSTYQPGRSPHAGGVSDASDVWEASDPCETWDSPYESPPPEAQGSC